MCRVLQPDDWQWMDVGALLAAEKATILSDLRFLTALRMDLPEDMLTEYLPARYGPRDADEDAADISDEEARIDRARSVAQELLGG